MVVVVRQPAETFSSMDLVFRARMLRLGTDQCIVQTLMVALGTSLKRNRFLPNCSRRTRFLFPKVVDQLQLLLVHPAGHCDQQKTGTDPGISS
jgi:hypothetical protein